VIEREETREPLVLTVTLLRYTTSSSFDCALSWIHTSSRERFFASLRAELGFHGASQAAQACGFVSTSGSSPVIYSLHVSTRLGRVDESQGLPDGRKVIGCRTSAMTSCAETDAMYRELVT
jgi:hypothetical protein